MQFVGATMQREILYEIRKHFLSNFSTFKASFRKLCSRLYAVFTRFKSGGQSIDLDLCKSSSDCQRTCRNCWNLILIKKFNMQHSLFQFNYRTADRKSRGRLSATSWPIHYSCSRISPPPPNKCSKTTHRDKAPAHSVLSIRQFSVRNQMTLQPAYFPDLVSIDSF